MIKLFFITMLMILFSQGVHAEVQTIEGAFGIKLGDEPDKKLESEKVRTKIGMLYFIEPPIKNEHFNEYAILVTTRTNKIFRIYAEKEQTTKTCAEELIKVKETLEKIYGKIVAKDNVYTVKQNEKEINLTCKVSKINKEDASLQIKYIDNQVYKDGIEEVNTDRRDDSGL